MKQVRFSPLSYHMFYEESFYKSKSLYKIKTTLEMIPFNIFLCLLITLFFEKFSVNDLQFWRAFKS